ncbi:MAG: MutS2/Smr-associated SH3 domain-containing protein, partial [Flavobacteriia bacterium]
SKKPKANKPEKDPYERTKITIGSTVKLISTKQSGTVEAMDGENVTVTFGFLRMKVEKDKLMWVK